MSNTTGTDRKLVTVRVVSHISPIKGADRIEVCTVDGWNVITKKGEFKVGDKGLFFEIDSFLPSTDDRFSFLGNPKAHRQYVGYRIKTIKLRGTLSQGLLLPLSSFPEITYPKLNKDYAELLKVVKYDNSTIKSTRQFSGAKNSSNNFPKFIRKTDQNRIQNVLQYFDQYKEAYFEETLKLDGSSITVYKHNLELTLWDKILQTIKSTFICREFTLITHKVHFGVCSRNVEVSKNSPHYLQKEDDINPFVAITNKLNLKDKVPNGYAIQGELISPSIQSNHEKVSEQQLHIFDVFDIINQRYLNPNERYKLLKECDLMQYHIPIVNESVQIFKGNTLEDLLKRVDTQSMNKGTISEGRVYKLVTNGDISFKVINNRYLLKCES